MDVQLILTAATLGFVVLMELTIVYVSYSGLRTAQDLQRRLVPVFRIFERMPAKRIEKAATFLDRKFKEWEEAEDRLEALGL